MPCGPSPRNRSLFEENYLDRTEVRSFPDLLFKIRWHRSFLQASLGPVGFSDLAEGIITPEFEKFRTDIHAGPAADAFVAVNPYLNFFKTLQ